MLDAVLLLHMSFPPIYIIWDMPWTHWNNWNYSCLTRSPISYYDIQERIHVPPWKAVSDDKALIIACLCHDDMAHPQHCPWEPKGAILAQSLAIQTLRHRPGNIAANQHGLHSIDFEVGSAVDNWTNDNDCIYGSNAFLQSWLTACWPLTSRHRYCMIFRPPPIAWLESFWATTLTELGLHISRFSICTI